MTTGNERAEREGETSEADIAKLASELVRFFRGLSPEAKRQYAELTAIDRELGERLEKKT